MIIGITGTIASGKETFAKIAVKKGFDYYNLSDIVKKKSIAMKLNPSREIHQNLGNFLREFYGNNYLIRELVKNLNLNSNFIIDGIRNPGEIEFLRENVKNFVLIGTKSTQKKRFERNLKRNKKTDPVNYETFVKVDRIDRGFGQPDHGQQVDKCIKLADFVITNNNNKKEFEEKAKQMLNKII